MPVMESIILVAGFILIIGAVLVLMKQNSMDPKIIVPLLLVLLILGSVMPSTIFNAELTPSGTPTPTPTPTATPIPFVYFDECGEINSGGFYGVNAAISGGLIDGKCFNLAASDVYLDCQGNEIDGEGLGIGMYTDTIDNITIKNCNFTNFDYGILALATNSSLFENNSFYNFSATSPSQILISSSNGINITESYFEEESIFGISGVNVDCATTACNTIIIANNEFTGLLASTGVTMTNGDASTIRNNSFNTMSTAISLYESDLVDVRHNNITDSQYGVYSTLSDLTFAYENDISGICTTGIDFSSSYYNWINNNTIEATCTSSIYLSDLGNGVIEFNEITNSDNGIIIVDLNDSLFYNNTITSMIARGFSIQGNDNDFGDNVVTSSGTFDFYCNNVIAQIDSGNTCGTVQPNCLTWLSSCP